MSFDVIFVEGFNDELFVRNIIDKKNMNPVPNIVKYSEKEQTKIDTYIKVINERQGHLIFLSDYDPDSNPVPANKVNKLMGKYPNLREEQIVLAFPEIEGWYIAGLDDDSRKEMGLGKLPKPDKCTKEKFRACLPKKSSELDMSVQILDKFDLTTAMDNSESFRTFIKKLENFGI